MVIWNTSSEIGIGWILDGIGEKAVSATCRFVQNVNLTFSYKA